MNRIKVSFPKASPGEITDDIVFTRENRAKENARRCVCGHTSGMHSKAKAKPARPCFAHKAVANPRYSYPDYRRCDCEAFTESFNRYGAGKGRLI